MVDFLLGVISSICAAGLWRVIAEHVWPYISDKLLYDGIRIDGVWDICELKEKTEEVVGKLTLWQRGGYLTGESIRTRTRGEAIKGDRNRCFAYRIVQKDSPPL